MPRIYFTAAEAKVTRDAMTRLSAFTDQEMRDHLGWDDEQMTAWDTAMDKLARATRNL